MKHPYSQLRIASLQSGEGRGAPKRYEIERTENFQNPG